MFLIHTSIVLFFYYLLHQACVYFLSVHFCAVMDTLIDQDMVANFCAVMDTLIDQDVVQ